MKHRILTLLFAVLMGLNASMVLAQDLASLVPDMAAEDLGVREKAQQAWQKVCMEAGAPGSDAKLADVNKQMCEQLEKDLPVVTKVWILHEMEWTGKADVVPTLAKLLNDSEKRISEEAVRALAKNPSEEALAALKNAKTIDAKVIADAIASRNVDLSIGVESVSPMNLPYQTDAQVKEWMKGYDKLSDLEKSQTLASLTVRKDRNYRKLALDAMKSDNETLRKNGILALTGLGTADDVPVMLDLLFGDDRDLLTNVMSVVVADNFDETLIKAMRAEKDAGRYQVIADILAKRQVKAIIPDLLTAAKKADCPNRLPLLGVLEQLSTKNNVGDLVDVVLLFAAGGERDDAERVIVRICKGDAAQIMKKLTDANKPQILPLMGRIGGDQVLELVNADLKSQNNAVRGAAFRALCNWPNASIAKKLLEIADNKQLPDSVKIPALRSFARVISLPDDQIGINISTGEKLDMLKKGMSLATRVDEKRLIIDRVSAVRDVETIKYVLEFIDDKELAQNVCNTIVELSHHDYLRRENKEIFTQALEKVLEISDDNGTKDRARWYLNRMQ